MVQADEVHIATILCGNAGDQGLHKKNWTARRRFGRPKLAKWPLRVIIYRKKIPLRGVRKRGDRSGCNVMRNLICVTIKRNESQVLLLP